jgi:hypothetical protein
MKRVHQHRHGGWKKKRHGVRIERGDGDEQAASQMPSSMGQMPLRRAVGRQGQRLATEQSPRPGFPRGDQSRMMTRAARPRPSAYVIGIGRPFLTFLGMAIWHSGTTLGARAGWNRMKGYQGARSQVLAKRLRASALLLSPIADAIFVRSLFASALSRSRGPCLEPAAQNAKNDPKPSTGMSTRRRVMNKSMLAGVGIGVASALALSAAASGSLFSSEPQFAEVLASKPVTETIKTPVRSAATSP